jgi:hypothetical protein
MQFRANDVRSAVRSNSASPESFALVSGIILVNTLLSIGSVFDPGDRFLRFRSTDRGLTIFAGRIRL